MGFLSLLPAWCLVEPQDCPLQLCDTVLGIPLRFSSVQLLGDLLFHISGVTGKMTTETASEDDNFGTAQSNKVRALRHFPCSVEGTHSVGASPLMLCSLFLCAGCRPSSLPWGWTGGTGCWQGCTWAALTPSWLYGKHPCTSGRLWSPIPPAPCVRSCLLSSGCSWVSWQVPVQIRER